MKKLLLLCVVLLASSQSWAQKSRLVDLSIGMYRIQAEVAATESDRQTGLMNRKSMPMQAGMLFVFERSAQYCFWMKNTQLPLSIAFIDEGGRIINIADMQPNTEESHCPSKPIRYALEMNQGWFRNHGAVAGTVVNGILNPAAR